VFLCMYQVQTSRPKDLGYTGNSCNGCGSMEMKRNGSCELCLSCGETTGCS